MKINGKSRKFLAVIYEAYIVNGKNLYYNSISSETYERSDYRVAKLNGSDKKKASIKAKNKYRDSNKRGYRIIYKKDKRVYNDYYEKYVESVE